jgi:hypothetical protein
VLKWSLRPYGAEIIWAYWVPTTLRHWLCNNPHDLVLNWTDLESWDVVWEVFFCANYVQIYCPNILSKYVSKLCPNYVQIYDYGQKNNNSLILFIFFQI